MKSKKKDYKFQEKFCYESKKPAYGGAFNFLDESLFHFFASVCGNLVTIHRCDADKLVTVCQYIDDSRDENFYSVVWMKDPQGRPLLAASGSRGVVRVIDCMERKVSQTLVGHGGAVNELKTQPLRPTLLLSASKDESVRLWSVRSGACAIVLGGARGHRNEVLSVDFHPSNIHLIASCGMDSSIRVWSIQDFWGSVEEAEEWGDQSLSSFRTRVVQYPLFIVHDVHVNYVDCLRWYGDFILSKCVDNEILLWRWRHRHSDPVSEGEADILARYPVPECDIWFIKFDLDFHRNTMAIGNRDGRIFVWDMQNAAPTLVAQLWNQKNGRSPVRQTVLSFDGRIIIGCCEDGTVMRWDLQTPPPQPERTPETQSSNPNPDQVTCSGSSSGDAATDGEGTDEEEAE